MIQENNQGHLSMAVAAANATTYFPAPSAGALTSPVDGFNYSVTSTDSPFTSGATRKAIIHSISASDDAAFILNIRDYDDSATLWTIYGSSTSMGYNYTFGPKGLRLPHGFCVACPTGRADIVITYEVE